MIDDSAKGSTASRLPQADRDFIEQRLPSVTGWLHPNAAYFTAYVMNRQTEAGLTGPALEFGVYHGKYLCLMLQACLRQKEWVGGFDTFELCHPETAWTHAEAFFGSREALVLWKESTADVSASRLKKMLGRPARIVSVDGDHTAKGALHDLKLAAAVMHRDGVVAVDDIYNPIAIGVSEGAFRFLLARDCELAPFALIANKTFLCRKDKYASYFKMAQDFVDDAPDLDIVQSFHRNKLQGDSWVIQQLVGHDVVLFN